MYKKVLKYLSLHPSYNAAIHILIGVGIGVLITYPLISTHPVRWGLLFLGLGLLGHIYPLWTKK